VDAEEFDSYQAQVSNRVTAKASREDTDDLHAHAAAISTACTVGTRGSPVCRQDARRKMGIFRAAGHR
jgi:hypothetical protein